MRDQLTSRLNEATTAVSDGYDDLAARVNEAADDLGDAVSDNYHQVAVRFGDLTKNVADGYGQTSDRVLDFVVDANRKVVEVAVSSADQVIEQMPEMPWADRLPELPTPAEAGDRYLEFVDQIVSVNRDFNHRMVRLLEQDVAARAAQSGAKPTAAKPTTAKSSSTKSTAKKSGAKKSTARKRAAKKAPASA